MFEAFAHRVESSLRMPLPPPAKGYAFDPLAVKAGTISFLFGKLHHSAEMLYYIIEARAPLVRNHAVAAILNAILRIGEIAAAIFAQRIERAIAKQAVKVFQIVRFVARKKFAFRVAKK